MPDWKVFIELNAEEELEATPGIIRPAKNETVAFYANDVDVVLCFESYTLFGLHRYRIERNSGILLTVTPWAPNASIFYDMVPVDNYAGSQQTPTCSASTVDPKEYQFDLMEGITKVEYDDSLPWVLEAERTEPGDTTPKSKRAVRGEPRNPPN